MTLHDIAPRLAAARDVERWNIWCAGPDQIDDQCIGDGEHWAETVSACHATSRHDQCVGLRDPSCDGVVDIYDIQQRLLYGLNRGRVSRIASWKCRRCNAARSRHT